MTRYLVRHRTDKTREKSIIKMSNQNEENQNDSRNNSYDCADTCAGGCDSGMGLQQRLGLWSEWGYRNHTVNSAHFGFIGAHIVD